MIKLFLFLLFSIFTLSVNAEDNNNKNINELSLGISFHSSGSFGEVSGFHTAIYDNPGDNIKKVRLTDDDLKKEHAVSIDYYRKLKNNLYLNASITHSHVKIKPISATFVVGGYVVDPAPPTTIKGFTFNLGPSYRFNSLFNLTPYIGLNVSYFDGIMTDTNYPEFIVNGVKYGNPNHKGEYGIGGPDSDMTCWGLNPSVGVFSNSGLFKGFGVVAKSQNLDCEIDFFRSFERGAKAENLRNIFYLIDYRIFF